MELILLCILCILTIANLIFVFIFRYKGKSETEISHAFGDLSKSLSRIEQNLKDDFRINRDENQKVAKENRDELNNSLKDLKKELSETLKTIIDQNTTNLKEVNKTLDDKLQLLANNEKEQNLVLQNKLEKSLKDVQENFDRNVKSFNDLQKDKFDQLEKKQNELVQNTEKKLEEMRATVDEKLQKTLSDRIGQSFETVGKQLEEVQKGLGEMRTLATDVGGLKKVLSNVKMRGGIGEVQLSMLLEQILAPAQYEANVKTKKGSKDLVEFAIKLPGKEEGLEQVWLPLDAKFPKDYYEQLQIAHESGDLNQIDQAQKALENAVKKMAKDISEKYIDPPNTTDFGIMFLPFEGIYAEVVRKSSFLEEIQKEYKVIVTGPSTLAALLNSLQMGFKTLAIQKSSGQVMKVLGAVKTEFEKFGGLLEKSRDHFQKGIDDMETLVGTRTNKIRTALKNIDAIPEAEAKMILPDSMTIDTETDG